MKGGATDLHPIALAFTLAMGIMMLTAKRDRAAVPILLVACLITGKNRIVIAGLDFPMLRILILFGWARVVLRGETSSYRFHLLDGVLLLWLLFGTIAYTFGPRGSSSAFVQRLGIVMDAAGTYFLFRVILRDLSDIRRTAETFGWLALVVVGPMMLENLTGRNFFSNLGGVPEITRVRDGKLRCQASFAHPIMAGNFGATTAALIGGLWLAYPKQRLRHTAALVAAGTVTLLSNSGGPLMVLAAAMLGWGLWFVHSYVPVIRWATAVMLVVLHFVREKPVWQLIGRASQLTGGTGYHRVKLINAWIAHFDEWWFLGAYSTLHWMRSGGKDITNQYLLEGIRGGLITFFAFVAVLVVTFRTVGRCVRRVLKSPAFPPAERRRAALLAWGLGVCMFAHSIAFIGVSYFGQLKTILFLHLAMVPAFESALARAEARARRAVAERPRLATPPAVAPAPSLPTA